MLSVLLVAVVLAGCGGGEPSIPVRWSAALLELPADADLGAEFARPFEEPVPVERGDDRAAASGCESAIDLLAQGFEPTTNVDYVYLKNAALTCEILRAIKEARPSVRSYLTDARLDAVALPGELGIGAGPVADGEEAIVAHPPGFEQRLELLARGDFNKDGTEDWLLREEQWATEGTSREVRAFIVTRDAEGGALRVVEEL